MKLVTKREDLSRINVCTYCQGLILHGVTFYAPVTQAEPKFCAPCAERGRF